MAGRTDSDSESAFAAIASWSQELRAAMKRLDPTQSRILQMVYFERCTHDEVARELELPRRTVARSLASAMQTVGVLMLAAKVD